MYNQGFLASGVRLWHCKLISEVLQVNLYIIKLLYDEETYLFIVHHAFVFMLNINLIEEIDTAVLDFLPTKYLLNVSFKPETTQNHCRFWRFNS